MSNDRSTEGICCNDACDQSKQHIIFGWDKFNARVWLFLVFSFIIWCLAFFLGYKPTEKQEMDHTGHENHGGHTLKNQ